MQILVRRISAKTSMTAKGKGGYSVKIIITNNGK